MRVLRLTVQNFLGVRAIDITPEGNVIKIEGKNGQGKSSVIQAIWAAIGGAAERPEHPIRNGEDKARIFIDLGDLTVTRSYTEKTETLTVRNKDGWEPKRQQDVLDALFTRVSLDPQVFVDMKPKERRELLLQITGQKAELEKFQAEKDKAFSDRTLVNREIRNLEGKLAGAPEDQEIPEIAEEEKSMGELMNRLRAAQQVDYVIQERVDSIRDKSAGIIKMRETIRANLARIDALTKEIEELAAKNSDIDREISATDETILSIQKSVDEAPPSVVAEIQSEIDTVDEYNADIRKQKAEREGQLRAIAAANDLRKELATKQAESENLTRQIDAAENSKLTILQNSALPIKNLTIDGDALLIGGIPFDDLSTSEKIKTSMEIGISQNPKLRVLRISRGRELDGESMAEVERFAAEHDCQVWIECVSDEPGGGIFIEDGAVKQTEMNLTA